MASIALDLRSQFRGIPKLVRDEHQDFSIRVWRALSWLERAEEMDASDMEGRFISCWIAFNALYGQLDDDDRPWSDRTAFGAFIARVWGLDQEARLHRVLGKRELQVLKLIGEKHLSREFWTQGPAGERCVQQAFKRTSLVFRKANRLPILQLLFDRLYCMRLQVFHGASTKGSRLNRRSLQRSAGIMLDLLPAFIEIMLGQGMMEDWGRVCFPPSH
ncbi:MAG: hypothetical protein ACE5F9_08080 [Phycisphaerae bacterium]